MSRWQKITAYPLLGAMLLVGSIRSWGPWAVLGLILWALHGCSFDFQEAECYSPRDCDAGQACVRTEEGTKCRIPLVGTSTRS